MTLFIACLLIYNFHMDPWWYGIAAGLWILQALYMDRVVRDNVKAASCRYTSN